MATFTAYDQVGKKEDISSIITNISPTKTPFQTMISGEGIHNIVHQWQEDSLISAAANAQVEGAAAPTEVANATVLRSNTTQILAKQAKASGTTDAIKSYGRDTELSYQLSLRAAELKRDFEFALVGSAAVSVAGSVSVARTMSGYQQMITLTGGSAPVVLNGVTATAAGVAALTGSTSAALTEAMVLTIAQQLYTNGTDPTTIMVKPADSLKIAAFATATGRSRYLDANGAKAKQIVNVVDTYVTPFGELKMVINRFQRTADALIFEDDMWRKLTLRNWFRTTLAQVGDATPVSITGEFSLKHRNYAASGLITGLG